MKKSGLIGMSTTRISKQYRKGEPEAKHDLGGFRESCVLEAELQPFNMKDHRVCVL